MIGATIHLGAGVRSLVMQGHTWDLLNLDRHQIGTIAGLISDTMGLAREPQGRRRFNRNQKVNSKAQCSANM